jgi:hypothetical protein
MVRIMSFGNSWKIILVIDDFGRNVEFAFKEHQASSDDSRRLVWCRRLYGPLNTYSTIEKTVKIITLLLWGLGVMAIGLEIQQNR